MKRDRVGSSVTDTKDIQENMTGTSPIPTCDIVRNKIFDFSRPKTDMKRSQILHKNDRLSPALEIAFKKTNQEE